MTTANATLSGLLAGVLAATGYSISLISAGFAFRAGADPATMVTVRGAVGVMIGIFMVRLMRQNLHLPANAVRPLVLMTLGMMIINYGYMGAIRYIPISLATLIFYMFPMVVLVISSLAARRWPARQSVLAFVMAFAGLAAALGSTLQGLDWRGLALALSATGGGTLMFFFGAQAARRAGIALFTFYAQSAVLALAIVVMMALDGPVLPAGTDGLFALLSFSAGYGAGITLQFFAVQRLPPELAALVFNAEPVITISLSALLLGDVLSTGQYLGGAFVIVGVLLATRVVSRTDANPAPGG